MAPQIHPHARVEEGVQIGDGTAVWHGVHIRERSVVGRSCILGEGTYIAYDVRIGDLVKINTKVYVCTGVTIGDGCLIAAHVVFTNERAPRATDPAITTLLTSAPTERTERTEVGRGVTIGANATIGPGVSLGDYCMVGMGAVVTVDVPAHGLVVGNPARLVGLVARDGTKVLGLRPGEQLPDRARIPCPDDGELIVRGSSITHLGGTPTEGEDGLAGGA